MCRTKRRSKWSPPTKDGNLASDNGQLFARVTSLGTQNLRQDGQIADLDRRTERLEDRVDGIDGQIGNIRGQISGLQGQIDDLGRRDRELADGIAIALAIQQPIFQPGQSFAIRAGYGNFDGNDAFGLSAAGVLDRGSFGRGSSVTLDAGIGFGTGTAAGRAGVTLGW